jgi:hypothetical protein
VTEPEPQPGTAAEPQPQPTWVPPAVETTETVPLPLSGTAPYPIGPSPAGPYAGGPYPGGPYPPPHAAAPYPYAPYPASAVPVSTMPGAYPAPYAFPYPVPPAPPARKGYGLLIAVIVGVVMLLMLGGVATLVLLNRHGSTVAAAAAPTGRTATPAPSPTPTAFSGDLRTLLLPVPPGATKLPNTNIGNADGTVSIDQAAGTFINTDHNAATYLKSMGYAQGATVGWKVASTSTSVHVELFQFYSTLTERWLQGIVDGFDTSDRIDARGDLPGVPGGRYYAFVHTSNDGSYAIECYFTKYDIAADIWVFTPGKPDPADLLALAQKQYALLP